MISVVVICHNYGRFLEKCVSSIIKADNKFLKEMISKIKKLSEMIGKIRTNTYGCEKYSKKTLRRSLYFSNNLKIGDKIKKEDLMTLRPYDPNSIRIEDINLIVGCKLKKNIKKNQIVKHDSLWLKKSLA